MGVTTRTLYDTDFVEWSARMAELLRAGDLDELDLDHLAEEIEDLGKSEQKSVRSEAKRLLVHLIKQAIQPERDCASWQISIEDARQKLQDAVEESPSLVRYLEEHLPKIYVQAARLAEIETGKPFVMAEKYPLTVGELLNDDSIT
jgi:hypothetical protein